MVTIPSPATSLLVYNTNVSMAGGSPGFYYWDGTKWKPVVGTEASNCTGAPSTPGAISGNPAVCTGGIGTYFIAPVSGATSYNWDYSGTGTTVSGTGNFIGLSFSDSATSGALTVTASNSCGTSSGSSNYIITVNVTPNSNFTYNPAADTLYTYVTFTAADPGNQFYFWTFPFVTFYSSSSAPSFTWPKPDTGVVTLTVTKNGCNSTTSHTLGVAMPAHGSQAYSFQDSVQTFVVPAGITSVTLDVIGAQACCHNNGGAGGRAVGTLAVTPGEILYLYVGSSSSEWNGGGTTGSRGGDASDVRIGDTTLANRIIVAGGGGGAGYDGSNWNIPGGAGGGNTGGPGSANGYIGGAGGGSQSAGGAGGVGGNSNGNPGSLGQGGNNSGGCNNAGSGGGGYYGGGGAALNSNNCYGAGGGGGSNYLDPSLTNTTNTQGYWFNNTGNGQNGLITVTW